MPDFNLEKPKPGDPISSKQQGHLIDAVSAIYSGRQAFIDSTGVLVRPTIPGTSSEWGWAKLDDAITGQAAGATGTWGIGSTSTASVWEINSSDNWADSGDNIEVVAPLNLESNVTLPVGTFVRYQLHGDGRRYITEWRLKARHITFTLAGTLTTSTASVSATVNSYCDGYNPGTTVTIYNMPAASNYIFGGVSGDKGAADYNEANGHYEIQQTEWRSTAKYIQFTLTASLSSSGAASTVTDYWDGYSPGATASVWNSQSIFSGDSGDKGIAVWDDRSSHYEVIQMECA